MNRMKKIFFAVLLFFITACYSITVPTKLCRPTPRSLLKSVSIEPCSSSPCHLKKGETYKMTINFTSTSITKELTTNLCGYVMSFICCPVKLPSNNACDTEKSGVTCPLNRNQDYSLTTEIFIDPSLPSWNNMQGKFNLVNENGVDFMCFYLNFSIVGGQIVSRYDFLRYFDKAEENGIIL